MLKLSEYLETQTMGEVLAERDKTAEKQKMKRFYKAARVTRLNNNWTTTATAPNYELRMSLQILRARSREQCRNNGYFKKFLSLCRSNIIGHKGIQLQVRAYERDGETLNTKLNRLVESAFWEWGHKEFCTVSQKLSWLDAQNLVITNLARDGEVLIRKVRARNKFGFALKFYDTSYLDENFNENLTSGNRVIMSVEVDSNDKPVAYYLTTPSADLWLPQRERMNRVRVPAEEIIHFFLVEDESQTRGVPWLHAALQDAKDLDGYKVGVITSARVAANTFGMVIPPSDDTSGFDGTDDEGTPIEINSAPLSIHELPPGYEFRQFDPKQPTQNHPDFYKSILHDLAVALDLNYFNLAGDLSDVNYSSARVGLLEERSLWRGLQNFVIEHFCREVYHAWLDEATLIGAIRLSARDYREAQNPMFRPRGWQWVDPQKEVNASLIAVQNKLSSYTDVLAEQGIDFTEHLETLKAEREMAARYGIELDAPMTEPQPQQTKDEPPPERGYTNGEYLDLPN